jgi:hypothetical protein
MSGYRMATRKIEFSKINALPPIRSALFSTADIERPMWLRATPEFQAAVITFPNPLPRHTKARQ